MAATHKKRNKSYIPHKHTNLVTIDKKIQKIEEKKHS